ncbi:MAG TPA: hypothetical protein VK403_08880 [Allosphingosinicella sp.]|nr:hypothetical protein [Allosphingosinicella sp.]
MFLVSLMLAAASTSAVKPEIAPRRDVARPGAAAASGRRSKRLVEFEAAVKSLPPAAADRQDQDSGPKGM